MSRYLEALCCLVVGVMFLSCCMAVFHFKILLWVIVIIADILCCTFIGIILVGAFTE
jgi:hypothetical protein